MEDTAIALDSKPTDGPAESTSPDTRTDTPSDTSSIEAAVDASLGPYPSGPYGVNAGDIIANFRWEGYYNDAADVLVDTKTYGSYSLEAARLTGRRYALIHIGEFF